MNTTNTIELPAFLTPEEFERRLLRLLSKAGLKEKAWAIEEAQGYEAAVEYLQAKKAESAARRAKKACPNCGENPCRGLMQCPA